MLIFLSFKKNSIRFIVPIKNFFFLLFYSINYDPRKIHLDGETPFFHVVRGSAIHGFGNGKKKGQVSVSLRCFT